MNPQVEEILLQLKDAGSEENLQGKARFGINVSRAYGVRIPEIRNIARPYKKNHDLALLLWSSEIHEARIAAAIIDDPALVTPVQMDSWIGDFNSWDLCDQCCMGLFVYTPYVFEKIKEWSCREPEFERRAAFALLASAAVHCKKEGDQTFIQLLPLIAEAADDERNFVKKAVNWALRQIGKRNTILNGHAMQLAEKLAGSEKSKSSRWIGKDALRELQTKFTN